VKEKKVYSYIVLVLLSLLMSSASVVISIKHDEDTGHDFCDVVSSVVSRPIPKPVDPKQNPSRERSYEGYLKFQALGRKLGC
jgi:hypothetical protein